MNSPLHHLIDKKSDDSQNFTVVCRVRPVNQRESSMTIGKSANKCISVQETNNAIVVNTKPDAKTFSFDYVADDNTSQEKMFQVVGIPITHTCLDGYNGTIICYGQTGSGKSHTTFGSTDNQNASRGLVPRVLEYIWNLISERMKNNANITFSCSCSFYEIYQEKVYDLLDATSFSANNNNNMDSKSLQVREDAKFGVYVEGCIEEFVNNPEDAKRILTLGTFVLI